MNAKNFLDIITKHDSGFISLSEKSATKEESALIREKLSAIFMGVDYGVSKVIDRSGTEIDLLFVADNFQNAGLKNVLIKCGKAFHQNSILFFPRKKPPLLISIAEKKQETVLPLKNSTPTLEDADYLSKLEIPYLKDAGHCTDLKSFSGFNAVIRKDEAMKIGKEYGIKLSDLRAEKKAAWQKNYIDTRTLSDEEKQQYKDEIFFKIIDNIDLFMKNFTAIKNNQSWYQTPLVGAYAGSTWTGARYFSLGQILNLWKYDEWITKCSCGGKVYLTNATGSLGSGRGYAWGYCDTCRTVQRGFKPFRKYFSPTMEYSQILIPYDIEIDSLDKVIRQLKLLVNL